MEETLEQTIMDGFYTIMQAIERLPQDANIRTQVIGLVEATLQYQKFQTSVGSRIK